MIDEVAARDAATRPEGLRAASLQELLPRWSKMIWWSGAQPIYRRMVEADLTMAESVVLRGLIRGPLTVSEVAGRLMISHSAASRAVDRLVVEGYVRREEDPLDRRQKRLTITPLGQKLIGGMDEIINQRLQTAIDALNPEEQEQLRALVITMIAATEAALTGADDCPVTRVVG